MYYCCTRSEGPICQGRGKDRLMIKYSMIKEAIAFAREYSIKHQKVCEVFRNDSKEWDGKTAIKVAAYKKGETIYYDVR